MWSYGKWCLIVGHNDYTSLIEKVYIVSSILLLMANHKANEPRVQMKVPISFRDYVMKFAHAQEEDATTFLEHVTILNNVEKKKAILYGKK
jgi:hypothetical protein